MKSLTEFIRESKDNEINRVAKNIVSFNDKDQRCTSNEAQAIIIDLSRKFKKVSEDVNKVPSTSQLQKNTWLIYNDANMILLQWEFNHFNTFYIQEKDSKESVICGNIYMDSKELDEFLVSKMGGEQLTYLNSNEKLLEY